jgi:hypothetical protein
VASGKNVRLDTPFALASRGAGTYLSQGNGMPESFTNCIIMVEVTVPGTSVDVSYEVSPDQGTTWFTRDSRAQIIAAGTFLHAITDTIGSFYRIKMVTVGTTTVRCWVEFKR